MNPYPLELPAPPSALELPLLLGKRVANIVLTAQVQLAYACAIDAQERALRAGDCIEQSWPATPVRSLVVDGYRAQAQSAARLAREVLQGARQNCGLAFARY
jgi:hypothetical protein